MVVLFLPSVFITEADFPATTDELPHTRLMECKHEERQQLWIMVRQALDSLHKQATGGERRHFGKSLSIVDAGLRREAGYADDAAEGGSLGQPGGTLAKPRKINVQKKLPQEAAAEYEPKMTWPSLDEFMTNFENEKLVAECDVSVFTEAEATTGLLLKIASEQLKTGLGTAIHCSPIRGVIAGKTPQPKEGPRARKAAKQAIERTTMLLNIDYQKRGNFFTAESLVHYVVWIIERPLLNALLDSRDPQIIRQGHYRHVVNQSQDKRRISVRPPMPGTSVNDGNKAIEISITWKVMCVKM